MYLMFMRRLERASAIQSGNIDGTIDLLSYTPIFFGIERG